MLSEVGPSPLPSPPPSPCCYLSYTSCAVHKLFTPPCPSPYRQDVIDTEDLSITLTSGRDWLVHRSPTFALRLSTLPRSHSFSAPYTIYHLPFPSQTVANDMTLTLLMWNTLDTSAPSLPFPLIPCMTLKMACSTPHPKCIDFSLRPVIATAYSRRVCSSCVCVECHSSYKIAQWSGNNVSRLYLT